MRVLKVDRERCALLIDERGWLDFSSRPTLWRILDCLIQAHENTRHSSISTQALIEATYPGERLIPEAAVNRMHYSLSTLRKAGLRPILERNQGGYRIPPGWLVQHVTQDGPPSLSLMNARRPKPPGTNLVASSDSFIGRRPLLKALDEQWREGRRVTLLYGPGGGGKTRLAKEAGLASLARFPGGVWFCDLAEIHTQAEMIGAVGRVMNVPLAHQDTSGQLGHALTAFGRTLLILDNVEQLSHFAAALVTQWRHTAAELHLLLTSRVHLQLSEATTHNVSVLEAEEAVTLFAERACVMRPDFVLDDQNRATVLEVVEALDRLPLAIELAASKVSLLNVAQLKARLKDRFRLLKDRSESKASRQTTMRATIDWSWDLASDAHRVALAQCSVFRGGFTLEAAEATLDLSALPDAPWPEEVIEDLVHRSLIHRVEPSPGVLRFVLFESIRDYAAQKLNQPSALPHNLSGDEARRAVQARHRRHYAGLGRPEVLLELNTARGREVARLLERDLENLQRAIESGVEAGDLTSAARAWDAAYWSTYNLQGPFHEVVRRARTLAELEGQDERNRATLLVTEATAWFWAGDLTRATSVAHEALSFADAVGDDLSAARAVRILGRGASFDSRFEAAFAYHDRAHQLFLRRGAPQEAGHELGLIATVHIKLGDFIQAHHFIQKAIQIASDTGDLRNLGGHNANLGLLFYKQGRNEEACRAYEHAIAFHERAGDLRSLGLTLINQALVMLATQNQDKHLALCQRAQEVCRRIGDFNQEGLIHGNLGLHHLSHDRLIEAREQLERGMHLLDEQRTQNYNLLKASLAYIHARQGDFKMARVWVEEACDKLQSFPTELGFAHLRRFDIEWLSDRPTQATEALEQAEAIVAKLNLAANSPLGTQTAQRRLSVDDSTATSPRSPEPSRHR